MVTLTGKLTDVTGRTPESISSITIKAPSARIGGGRDIIVTSNAQVDFNEGTGSLTLTGLHVGLSWLYIEGDGWSDSIPLAVAEGFQLILEAVANASGIPGIADYVLMIRNSGSHARELARAAVDGEFGEVVRLTQAAATTAAQAATSAEAKAGNAVSRVDALEAMSGLSPESPVDGQTANLVAQSDTLTRTALETSFARVEGRSINVFHHGVSPANSPADNRAAFQAVIDAAPEGATIYQPSTSPSERVYIDGAIVPRPGMTVSGLGGRAFIAQETWGAPVFDLPYGKVTISHWDALSIPGKSAISGTFRDGSAVNAATVVWLGGHNGHLEDIKGTGFTSVCRATPWDEQSGTLGEFSEGHIFENIEVDGCDWGVVGSGWVSATVKNIRGTYSTRAGSTDPGHLVYIAPQRQSRDVMISDCMAVNGTGGRAYSLKNVDVMDVTNITARSCDGLMDYTELKNVRWSGLRALDDRDATQDGCIYGFGGDVNSFMQVSDVFLEIHPLARAIRVDGIEGVWRNITVLVSRTAFAETPDIYVHGEGNTIQDAYVHNRTAFSHRFISALVPRTRILAPRAHQTTVVATVSAAADGTLVEYDPAGSTLNTSGAISTHLVNSSPTAVVRIAPTIQRVTTSGDTVRGYSSQFSTMQISVIGAGVVTINSPYDRPNDHEVTYEITNTTDAAMGGLSFVGAHVMNDTLPPPAPGDTHSITFRYDGVENLWREVRRGVAPTPDPAP